MTLMEQLFHVADATANARARLRVESKALSAIERACNQAKRAWSGSNLGYHATVYYEDLQPPPPGANFSPEWGLEERFPVNQPDPGWTEMDHQAVIDIILARAGSPDIESIESMLKQLREKFSDLKERAISLFTALQTKDPFLDRKVKQIELLNVVYSGTIAPTLARRLDWSRDSLAVTQGHRVAPHQSLIAIPLSATVLENGLDALEKATHEAALHLERLAQRKREMTATGKTVFIGHGRSPIWLELKEFLKERLHLTVDEFNSVPPAGIPTAIRLEELLDRAAFAFLVMTAEDEQSDGTVRARENVVHEAGLFQGRLGFRKAIILLEDTCKEFSNINGLGQIRVPRGKINARFEEMRRVLEREGLIATP
jgi:predicted nucleotide-binding protein